MQDFNQFNALDAPISSFPGGFQSVPKADAACVPTEGFQPDNNLGSKSVSPGIASNASVPWVSPNEPMYKYISRLLRADIERGRYKPGSKLPSVRTMVVDFNVSHPTVLRALEELASTGYVKLVQGSGTYVSGRLLFPTNDRLPSASPVLDGNSSKLPYNNSTNQTKGTEAISSDTTLPIGAWQRCVKTALCQMPPKNVTGGTQAGLKTLRKAIAEYVRRSRGIFVEPEQVFVTAGVSSAVSLISQLFLASESIVAMEDPGSPKMRRLFSNHCTVIKPIPLDSQGVSVEALKGLESRVNLLHVTPHQNPTGIEMTKLRRESLLNWASHAETIIVEDNFGTDFSLATCCETSLFSQQSDREVVYLGGFWGSLYPLVQTAYLLLPPALVEHLVTPAILRDGEINLLEQNSLRHLLDEGHLELHLRRSKKTLMEKRALSISALKQTLGARVEIIGSSVNEKQLVRFRDDVETRNIVTAALRSGLPLVSASDCFIEAIHANEFFLAFSTLETKHIFNTVLHFAGLIK